MGSQPIQFLNQFPIPVSLNSYRDVKCFTGGRSGGSRWDWEKKRSPNRRSRFIDPYLRDDYDDDFEFSSRKQRRWWSDDYYGENYREEDEGFGILEASIGFNWIVKVFRAFGWMIPAVMVSLLVGTGPNSIAMALAVPLVQKSVSLAMEALLGKPNGSSRTKSKRKRKPFSRVKKEKVNQNQTGKGTMDYKSWVDDTNHGSSEKMNPDFGGWDQLDNREEEVRVGNGKQEQEREQEQDGEVKISRRSRGDSDTPLLMRILIAMFPFMGFWTKFF